MREARAKEQYAEERHLFLLRMEEEQQEQQAILNGGIIDLPLPSWTIV